MVENLLSEKPKLVCVLSVVNFELVQDQFQISLLFSIDSLLEDLEQLSLLSGISFNGHSIPSSPGSGILEVPR